MAYIPIAYHQVGKIASLSGVHGEVVLLHSLGRKCDFKKVRAIFLEIEPSSYLPYFIEQARAISATETLIKFDELHSREASKKLVQKNAFLTEEDWNRQVQHKTRGSLMGYTILFREKVLGQVQNILEQQHQALLSIDHLGKEILIPLHEGTLIEINQRKKEIRVELPEGLLEVFLEE